MSVDIRPSDLISIEGISTSTESYSTCPSLQSSAETVEMRTEQAASAPLCTLGCIKHAQWAIAGITGISSVTAGTLALVFGFCVAPPSAVPILGLAHSSYGCCAAFVLNGIWAARTEDAQPVAPSMN